MITIDRTQATLPDGHSLWKAIFTYGGTTRVSVLVSAETERQAKEIVNSVYDYLSPKMLVISFVDNDKLNIKEIKSMKKEFYALKGLGNGEKKLEKKEGDFDRALGVYFHKEKNGWAVTDSYTGSSIVVGKATKKDAQDALNNAKAKLKEIRNGEKYLQTAINYGEMLEDAE